MKILTQNKQTLINSEMAFRISIEGEGKKSKIVCVNNSGESKILGFYSNREVSKVFSELIACQSDVYVMPRSEIHSGGRLLSETELSAICSNLNICKHAVERMLERGFLEKVPKKETLTQMLVENFKNNYLCFWNDDASVTIALDENHYFVVKYQYTPYNCYVVMTYCAESINGVTVSEKRKKAMREYKKRMRDGDDSNE